MNSVNYFLLLLKSFFCNFTLKRLAWFKCWYLFGQINSTPIDDNVALINKHIEKKIC